MVTILPVRLYWKGDYVLVIDGIECCFGGSQSGDRKAVPQSHFCARYIINVSRDQDFLVDFEATLKFI